MQPNLALPRSHRALRVALGKARAAPRTASAKPVGAAPWWPPSSASSIFFPVLWIILTAFKTYEDALAVPAKFIFTPDPDEFRAGLQPGLFGRRPGAKYRVHALFLQLAVHSGVSVLLRASDRHARRLRFSRYPLKGNDTYLFMILSTRMLPRDRGHHSDIHHVPGARDSPAATSASSRYTPHSICLSRFG